MVYAPCDVGSFIISSFQKSSLESEVKYFATDHKIKK